LYLNDGSSIRGSRARKLGWKLKYDVKHLYDTASAEAAEIAANIKAKRT
jgi:hypothetical protein